MTQPVLGKKIIPFGNRYPKSNKVIQGKVAKIQFDPKKFKLQYKNAKFFAIGDSFVNMFLHVENAFFIKLKGKSIKGLVKVQKEERQQIKDWVDSMPSDCQVVFNFGQVDLNLVRYYKLAHGETYPDETFQEYVEWIGSLSRKCIILGILKSAIKREHITDVLAKYRTLQGVEVQVDLILEQHSKTEQIRRHWNLLIQAACSKHSVKYINIFSYNKQLDPKFIDQNPQTIHLRYLPTIIELKKQLPQLSINIMKSLQIQDQYVTEKTNRYHTNLELMEEMKRLEALTENNSSTGPEEVEMKEKEMKEMEIKEMEMIELASDNGKKESIKVDQMVEKKSISQSEQIVKQQVDPQQQAYQLQTTQNDNFIQLLCIPGIKTAQQIFDRLHQPHNQMFLSVMSYQIISKGIAWLHYPQYQSHLISSLLNLLKDIFLIYGQENQQKKKQFTLSFVTCLQQLFQEGLENQKQAEKHDMNIEKVIKFLLFLFKKQQQLDFTILRERVVRHAIGEILLALFDRLIDEDTLKSKIIPLKNCLINVNTMLGEKMDEILLIALKKKKLTQEQLYKKFLKSFPFNEMLDKNNKDKMKQQFLRFITEECTYAAFSTRILSAIVWRVQTKSEFQYYCQQLQLIQKYQLPLNGNSTILQEKITQLDKEFREKIKKVSQESHQRMEIIQPHHYCKCGCLEKLLLRKQ